MTAVATAQATTSTIATAWPASCRRSRSSLRSRIGSTLTRLPGKVRRLAARRIAPSLGDPSVGEAEHPVGHGRDRYVVRDEHGRRAQFEAAALDDLERSEEHTSELQSRVDISY